MTLLSPIRVEWHLPGAYRDAGTQQPSSQLPTSDSFPRLPPALFKIRVLPHSIQQLQRLLPVRARSWSGPLPGKHKQNQECAGPSEKGILGKLLRGFWSLSVFQKNLVGRPDHSGCLTLGCRATSLLLPPWESLIIHELTFHWVPGKVYFYQPFPCPLHSYPQTRNTNGEKSKVRQSLCGHNHQQYSSPHERISHHTGAYNDLH